MKNVVVLTEWKGKEGYTSVNPENISRLDLGPDGHIRLFLKDGDKTFPVIDVLEADADFMDSFDSLVDIARGLKQ